MKSRNTRKISFAQRLLRWYDAHRRELPWRAARGRRPQPYHVLVSEAMLQQTQVATVIPYFLRFIQRLPTLARLAAADEQTVLKLWQGLGYYSRARNLQLAAKRIVLQHGGEIPRDVMQLLELPGVGQYTAGAIASLAYDVRAPILDGNVTRVLCRLDGIENDPRGKEIQSRLWARAEEILPRTRIGDFNSALMELGATVCTPRAPQCPVCPLRSECQALAKGLQQRIPAPKAARPVPLVKRSTWCLRHGDNGQTRWLIERRPPRGRWPGLWQFITTEADKSVLGVCPDVKLGPPRSIGTVEHALTHRRYRFGVYLCDVAGRAFNNSSSSNQRWVRLQELSSYPLTGPQEKIAQMLRNI
jgi:A/G-specific adenine glycosylase